MFKRKLTLMVVPDSSGTSRQLQLPVALLWGAVGFAGIALFLIVFLATDFFSQQVSRVQVENLRAENEQLMEKYERLRWDMAEISDRYDRLTEKEIAIRTMFDLPEVNSEERQLGVGGPTPPVFANMSSSEKYAFKTERQVDQLLRLADFELEKFEEITNELVALKDRLDHTPSIWPTKGWLGDKFGYRSDPFTGYRTFHHGIDIGYPVGTPIVATGNGRVKSAGRLGSLGNVVIIDHGYGFITRYGHLSKINVKRGQTVKRGDVLAFMGKSGRVTGSHLHYEVWRNGNDLNPRDHILNKLQK